MTVTNLISWPSRDVNKVKTRANNRLPIGILCLVIGRYWGVTSRALACRDSRQQWVYCIGADTCGLVLDMRGLPIVKVPRYYSDGICHWCCDIYAAVLIGRITSLTYLFVRPSVCLSRASDLKKERLRKAKIGVSVPHGRNNHCINFQVKS